MRTLLMIALLGLLSSGCARYEYDLVQPPELARHVGSDTTTLTEPPLAYHMTSYQNRLVIRVENIGAEAVQLVGERSWVVTPDGESRPLVNQSIAPDSHIKMILPPMQPRVARTGPSIGIGFGVSSGGVGTGVGVGTPLRTRTYIRDDDAYWDWEGESEVRMHLVFEQGETTFTRDFTFARRKM